MNIYLLWAFSYMFIIIIIIFIENYKIRHDLLKCNSLLSTPFVAHGTPDFDPQRSIWTPTV